MDIMYFQVQDEFKMPILQRGWTIYIIMHMEDVQFGSLTEFWTILKGPFLDPFGLCLRYYNLLVLSDRKL